MKARKDRSHSPSSPGGSSARHSGHEPLGATSKYGYTYDVVFEDYVGDLPLLEPHFAPTLRGGTVNATAVVDGACAHVKTEASPLVEETQVVRVAQQGGASSSSYRWEGHWSLGFRGHTTAPLAWDAEPQCRRQQALPLFSLWRRAFEILLGLVL